eukprot:3691876-Rhodomonas_salina.5
MIFVPPVLTSMCIAILCPNATRTSSNNGIVSVAGSSTALEDCSNMFSGPGTGKAHFSVEYRTGRAQHGERKATVSEVYCLQLIIVNLTNISDISCQRCSLQGRVMEDNTPPVPCQLHVEFDHLAAMILSGFETCHGVLCRL